jgi:acetyl-CoA C-acetyltransferase
MQSNHKIVVVGGLRTPFCRAFDRFDKYSNESLMTETLKALVKKFHLKDEQLGEVALGAVLKHPKDYNLARNCTLRSGLSPHTPGVDIQRACATSLSALSLVASKIATGQIESGIAGGVDSISNAPLCYSPLMQKQFNAYSKNSSLIKKIKLIASNFLNGPNATEIREPLTGLNMGESMELTTRNWEISRQDQDEYSIRSHQKAVSGYNEGFYQPMLVDIADCSRDDNIRLTADTNKLAKLPTVFSSDALATLTAGNSTPLTDGASAVLIASEAWALKRNLPIKARLLAWDESAINFVGDEGLLMGPAYSIGKLLIKENKTLSDIDFFEIHEAFASQTLSLIKALGSQKFCSERLGLAAPIGDIDLNKLNVYGGSLSLGHPFAATGGRLVLTLAELLHKNKGSLGLLSCCTAGGMAVSALIESI